MVEGNALVERTYALLCGDVSKRLRPSRRRGPRAGGVGTESWEDASTMAAGEYPCAYYQTAVPIWFSSLLTGARP